MKDVLRIWIEREGKTKKLVVVEPPFPTVGETVKFPDGAKWTVRKVQKDRASLIPKQKAIDATRPTEVR